jgi:hypothetical protein
MQPVNNKVAVGATSATATTAPVVIFLWLLSAFGLPAPPAEVVAALSGILAGGAALVAGYIKRELNLPNGESK